MRRRFLIFALYVAANLSAVGCVLPIGEPIHLTKPAAARTAPLAVYVDSTGRSVTRQFTLPQSTDIVTAVIPFSRVNAGCLMLAVIFAGSATGLILCRAR